MTFLGWMYHANIFFYIWRTSFVGQVTSTLTGGLFAHLVHEMSENDGKPVTSAGCNCLVFFLNAVISRFSQVDYFVILR